MSRIALTAFILTATAFNTAGAEIIRIEAERRPVCVDIAPIQAVGVTADELNPWANRFDDILLRRDIPLGGEGLFLRVYPDLATGEVFEPQEEACADLAAPPE